MLDKNLETRYSKFEQISNHIYFKDFNWDELISLNMKSVYLPTIPNIESKYRPKPFVEMIKSFGEWNPPEKMKEPDKKQITEFNEWFNKF